MNHYERLGVPPDATPAQLRTAYRRAARDVHPDRAGDASSAAMAAINEAYRVLSDPALRRRYDDLLAAPVATGQPGGGPSAPGRARVPDDADLRARLAVAATPSRFPWRFLLAMGVLAIGVVVVAAVLTDPPAPAPIDNILRPGDCVVLTPTLEAAESACTGTYDARVRVLVPFDQTCPNGTEAYRDRQGMGTACVVRVADAGTGATT